MGQSMRGAPVLLLLVAFGAIFWQVSGRLSERQSDEITLEREKILVNFRNGTGISLMVEPNDSICTLRFDMSEQEGVPAHLMMLEFGDIQLKDYRTTLSDYNIRAGSIVTAVIPHHLYGRRAEFSVRTLDGRELTVVMQHGDTVASLKEYITQKIGISKEDQRLLIRGKELKDERKLIMYEIPHGSTVNLGGQLDDCRHVVTIFVKTLSGATIELTTNLADSVNDLKENIWRNAGIPVGVQRLFANGRVITGEDYLCDLGLEAGSTVYMFLYSSRITSPNQVSRLREPPLANQVNNYNAPIFREVEDVVPQIQIAYRFASLYKDERNWIAQIGPRPGWERYLFDPVADLSYSRGVLQVDHDMRDASNSFRALILRALDKLSTVIRPYSMAANQYPCITLDGGFTGVCADINNWAPDAFSDSDLMRLFEVREDARQLLARAKSTGETILTTAKQRLMNHAILFSYLEALASYPPSVEHNEPRADEDCSICLDELRAGPAIMLHCNHGFHVECIIPLVTNFYQQGRLPGCPTCNQRFMIPYEVLGNAELKALELRDLTQ